jgi:hypothetical protein
MYEASIPILLGVKVRASTSCIIGKGSPLKDCYTAQVDSVVRQAIPSSFQHFAKLSCNQQHITARCQGTFALPNNHGLCLDNMERSSLSLYPDYAFFRRG